MLVHYDVMVLTEAKGWAPQWTNELDLAGYQVTETNANGRGGVVTINRMSAATVQVKATNHNTFHLLEMRFNNNAKEQCVLLMSSYINPSPDDSEVRAIEAWKEMMDSVLSETVYPIILTGDLNKQGTRIAKQWVCQYGLNDYIQDQITWKRSTSKGSLDALVTRGITLNNIDITWRAIFDHACCSGIVSALIEEKPE